MFKSTKRKTEQDYRNVESERGFKLVGEMPKNTNTKARWECQEVHEWEATYSFIAHGSGCPHSSNVNRNAKIKANRAKQNGYELYLLINYWDYGCIAKILTDRLQDCANSEHYKQARLL